ncbi:LuxR family transcriptional regulator [Arsenicicoccus piscis]|uniref:helix-turn-helix transcriptional regulator n=1 Tax=Arsenicicoccus piscis TaxID=673954 RepID=UPI001F4CF300|nr:LuxR family transcriptional regulator [Arsenicicoccus piscis]MCH8626960.1 LuxR family transcriptional regulator [Arsenicicoccus piscis]
MSTLPTTGGGPPGARGDPPCLGRVRELAVLLTAVDAGGTGLAVVRGPCGIGKTRVLREVHARAAAAGRSCVAVSATHALRPVPFGALLLAFPDLGSGDLFSILRDAAALVDRLSLHQPLLFLVDDVDELDDCTVALVRHVAQTGRALAIATVREADSPTATLLVKDFPHTEVVLGPLARSAADTLATLLHGASLPRPQLDRLWRLCEGHPLYLSEAVRHALTSGLEEQSPPGTTDEALRLLAQARLRAVPPELALLLDVLAYLGRSRLRRLARLGIGPATVERAEDAGLVRTERTTCGLVVSWPHPYIGELRRSLLTPVRRLQVARRLWESKDASDDVVSLALWHRDGEIAPPPGLYLRAASRAMHNLDLPLALGLATDAVAAGDGAEASALLALLLVLCGRAGEADAHLASIVWSAPGDGGPDTVDPHALARLVALRSWCLNFALKRPRAATDVLDRATAALADGPGVVPVLAVQRAQQASFRGDPRETLAWTAMVIEDDEAPIDVVGAALQLRCAAQTLGGQLAGAVESGRAALAQHRASSGDHWTHAREEALASLATALTFEGDLPGAGAIITERLEACRAAAWPAGEVVWSLQAAQLALFSGRLTEAQQLMETADLALPHDFPYTDWLTLCRHQLAALVAAASGRPAAARAELTALGDGPDARLGAVRWWAGSARVHTLMAEGHRAEALVTARREVAEAHRAGQHGWEVIIVQALADLGAVDEAAALGFGLEALLTGRWPRLRLCQIQALGERDGRTLLEVADGYQELGLSGPALGAARQAARLLAHGAAHDVRAARRRLEAFRACCTGPEEEDTRPGGGLTAREQEIAELAADGLTSAAIAARLVLSTRTIDNTLGRVYTKLGVAGRQDLNRVVRAPSLPK